jgi:hypothetical protein
MAQPKLDEDEPEFEYESSSSEEEDGVFDLSGEPSEGDPDSCTISFRLPDASTVSRRFLSTEQVGHLYVYI